MESLYQLLLAESVQTSCSGRVVRGVLGTRDWLPPGASMLDKMGGIAKMRSAQPQMGRWGGRFTGNYFNIHINYISPASILVGGIFVD